MSFIKREYVGRKPALRLISELPSVNTSYAGLRSLSHQDFALTPDGLGRARLAGEPTKFVICAINERSYLYVSRDDRSHYFNTLARYFTPK